MNLQKPKDNFVEEYLSEARSLSKQDLHTLLDLGKRWDLAPIFQKGGSALFPHTFLRKCGAQIAAVVQGCLDAQVKQVLVIGVAHTQGKVDLLRARMKEFSGEDISKEPWRGIYPEFLEEYSLNHFRILWEAECERRGISGPELVVRYPFLVGSDPSSLCGIEELEELTQKSLVIGTGDLVHHGVTYDSPADELMEISPDAQESARDLIEKSFSSLANGDDPSYHKLSYEMRNDAKDVCFMLRHLFGPQKATIHDIRLVDTSSLFPDGQKPSWVAASLISLTSGE